MHQRRIPEGESKAALLGAIKRVQRVWVAEGCGLDDRLSCPRFTPTQLTAEEISTIREMVESQEYRHVPTGRLAVLPQRLGKVCASATTWWRMVRERGWCRPRHRVYPAKPKFGVRAPQPDELWHVDLTIVKLLDGTQVYLHAVIDNYSRRILAWCLSSTFPRWSPTQASRT